VDNSLWNNAFFSVMPTILVGLIFWFIMRAIVRADRTERKVQAKVEAEERARLGQPATDVNREA
jgi:flagellar biosynthesis/type III secretory pathway M-ring protein FliF/YscJ